MPTNPEAIANPKNSGDQNDPKHRIRDLCSEALAATDPGQIEPILSNLRVALHEKVQTQETWMALCERAAVEQDPKKLLELVTEINRLFAVREERLSRTKVDSTQADNKSNI